jgi:hypothetical protein
LTKRPPIAGASQILIVETCGKNLRKGDFAGRISNKIGDEVYAVYYDYESDYTKPFSYFIGCRVKINSVPAPGMDTLIIPEQSYTKFIAKVKCPAAFLIPGKTFGIQKSEGLINMTLKFMTSEVRIGIMQ